MQPSGNRAKPGAYDLPTPQSDDRGLTPPAERGRFHPLDLKEVAPRAWASPAVQTVSVGGVLAEDFRTRAYDALTTQGFRVTYAPPPYVEMLGSHGVHHCLGKVMAERNVSVDRRTTRLRDVRRVVVGLVAATVIFVGTPLVRAYVPNSSPIVAGFFVAAIASIILLLWAALLTTSVVTQSEVLAVDYTGTPEPNPRNLPAMQNGWTFRIRVGAGRAVCDTLAQKGRHARRVLRFESTPDLDAVRRQVIEGLSLAAETSGVPLPG